MTKQCIIFQEVQLPLKLWSFAEMSQGNSCIAILNKQKCHIFWQKTENSRAVQVLPGGVGTSGRSEDMGRGSRGWIWCKYCVLMDVNGKMRPVETHQGMGGW
jgi:hypothetical protein